MSSRNGPFLWSLLICLLLLAFVLTIAACGGDDDDDNDDATPAADDDDSAPDDDDDDDDTVDAQVAVLTVNIQNPLASPLHIDQRNQAVADLIVSQQPDFVALEEVTEGGLFGNRAEAIADLAGYNWVWEPTHNFFVFEEGLAILSRWPIAFHDIVSLPHPDLFGLAVRSVLVAGAQTELGELQFFCSHWTIDKNEIVKADQAAAALEFIESLPSAWPGFFAGDLNAQPDSLAMQVLRGEAEHQGQSGNLIDAWVAANGDAPGYTHSAQNPQKRIDYIYEVPSDGWEVTTDSCELVFTEPVDGVWVTDHIGLLCRFGLQN